MKNLALFLATAASIACATDLQAQRSKKRDADFVKSHPAVGDSLPESEIFTPTGEKFSTSTLKGHYTVLVFGCLT